MPYLSSNEGKNYIYDWLRLHCRTLAPISQKDSIMSVLRDNITPLKLKLVANICKKYTANDIICFEKSDEESIVIKHFNDMFVWLGHRKELVLYALALIASSPYGITEDELQTILIQIPSVYLEFKKEDKHNLKNQKLPFIIWSRLFYDLSDCLIITVDKNMLTVKFSHAFFYSAFQHYYPTYYKKAKDILIKYYMFSYANENNARAPFILFRLLSDEYRYQELSDLIIENNFLKSLIYMEELDTILDAESKLLSNCQNYETIYRLKKRIYLLKKHRETLLCYPGSFENCIAQLENESFSNSFYFPYSTNSSIVFDQSKNRYAVYYECYVSICDSATQIEYCNIFCGNYLSHIQKVTFMKEDRFAVATESMLIVYDISSYNPRIVWEISIHTKEFGVWDMVYAEKEDLFVFPNSLEGNMLQAVNAEDGTSVYTYNLVNPFVEPSLFFDGRILYFKESGKKVNAILISNGQLIKSFSVKRWSFSSYDHIRIYKIKDSQWLTYLPGSKYGIEIFECKTNFSKYILPSITEIEKNALVYSEGMILIYQNYIIHIIWNKECSIKYYSHKDIQGVFWHVLGKSVIVVSTQETKIVLLKDMKEYFFSNGLNLYSKLNLTGILNFFGVKSKNEKSQHLLSNVFFAILYKNDCYSYKVLKSNNESKNNIIDSIRATFRKKITNNYYAIGYEGDDLIVIFNAFDKPIVEIDKLYLSIINSLQDVISSPNEQYICIWCTLSLKVFNIEDRTLDLHIDLMQSPAAFVALENDCLFINLCDGTVEKIFLNSSSKKQKLKPIITKEDLITKDYFGPFQYVKSNDKYMKFPVMCFDEFSCLESCESGNDQKKFNDIRAYSTEDNDIVIFYKNGKFYIDEICEFNEISCKGFDFEKSLTVEFRKDKSFFYSVLREKRDIHSKLWRTNESQAILVSYRLNSCILFDLKKRIVLWARKITGNIIGAYCSVEKKELSLYTDNCNKAIVVFL